MEIKDYLPKRIRDRVVRVDVDADFVQYRDGSGDSGRKKELYQADYETTTYSTLWNAVCDDKIINVN
mgnify:CR=1 FL=1